MSHLPPKIEHPIIDAILNEPHPFYPVALELPTYLPNSLHPIILLVVFFTILALFLLFAVRRANQVTSFRITRDEKWWVAWFAACGIIHITFEGYFAYTNKTLVASNHIEAQMWKMYALSDSRYITSDTFTVLMEGCTAALWGPLCVWLAFYGIPRQSSFRHPIQMIASMGQLYGLILYYGIPIIDEFIGGPIKAVSRPEWIYFWAEFVGLNFPWLVIPSYAVWRSSFAISDAFKLAATAPAANGKSTPTLSRASSNAFANAAVDKKAEEQNVPFIPSIVHQKQQ